MVPQVRSLNTVLLISAKPKDVMSDFCLQIVEPTPLNRVSIPSPAGRPT